MLSGDVDQMVKPIRPAKNNAVKPMTQKIIFRSEMRCIDRKSVV